MYVLECLLEMVLLLVQQEGLKAVQSGLMMN
jgi:hypothetical protein